jgi:hypothetical protein
MQPMILGLIGTVVLLLDIFAIVSVLVGNSMFMRKLIWIALIILLPIGGMLLYFVIGRNATDAHV